MFYCHYVMSFEPCFVRYFMLQLISLNQQQIYFVVEIITILPNTSYVALN